MLLGLGLGVASVASTARGTEALDAADQGLASGLLATSAQLGTALGLAVVVPVAAARTAALGGGPAPRWRATSSASCSPRGRVRRAPPALAVAAGGRCADIGSAAWSPRATSSSRRTTPIPTARSSARSRRSRDTCGRASATPISPSPQGRLKLREEAPGGATLIAYERPDDASERVSSDAARAYW